MKPWTRFECRGEGACPYVACRFNLILDVTSIGSIKINVGHTPKYGMNRNGSRERRGFVRDNGRVVRAKEHCDTDEIADRIVEWIDKGNPTCALDLVERDGPLSLSEIASILGITREAVRQIEARAMRQVTQLALTNPVMCDAS